MATTNKGKGKNETTDSARYYAVFVRADKAPDVSKLPGGVGVVALAPTEGKNGGIGFRANATDVDTAFGKLNLNATIWLRGVTFKTLPKDDARRAPFQTAQPAAVTKEAPDIDSALGKILG